MLGAEYVELIHDELISVVWPGSGPMAKGELRDRGLLESAVNRPFQSAFGQDAYPDIHQKATALFQSLISNHPFTDGNKRTAVLSLFSFLVANGQGVLFNSMEMYETAIRMASYRERNLSHEESFNEVLSSIRKLTLPLVELEGIHTSAVMWDIWYRGTTTFRLQLRASRLNKLIPTA